VIFPSLTNQCLSEARLQVSTIARHFQCLKSIPPRIIVTYTDCREVQKCQKKKKNQEIKLKIDNSTTLK
jgi:hypothetical protein